MPHFRKLHIKTLNSLDFDALPDDFARLTWTLLPLISCKEGRGMMHLSWLRSQLYPLRNDVTDEMISAAMQSFIGLDMVVIYSIQGRDYYQITKWHEYQNTKREADSPYPEPNDTNSGLTQEQLRTNSGLGEAIHARTSSISISNSISNSKGGVGGNDMLIMALASIVKETLAPGFNEQKYEDAAYEMAKREATPEQIAAFGEWWPDNGWHNGKPALLNVLDNWQDFLNGKCLKKTDSKPEQFGPEETIAGRW